MVDPLYPCTRLPVTTLLVASGVAKRMRQCETVEASVTSSFPPCLFIQQALLQVLQPQFDPTFSDASYGFRPGRRAPDAVRCAQAYVLVALSWILIWKSSSNV
jgi:hypothetical protein